MLSNNNAFLCWTYSTRISEHTANGTLIAEASLRAGKHSYRAYKFPWTATPIQPPDVYSQAFSVEETVTTMAYVSWNGATEVAAWNLYRTDRNDKEQLIAAAQRHGFETTMQYNGFAKYVIAEALDIDGEPIGRSEVVTTIPPSTAMFGLAMIQEAQWVQGYIELTNSQSGLHQWIIGFFIGLALPVIVGVVAFVIWRKQSHPRSLGVARSYRYDLVENEKSSDASSP